MSEQNSPRREPRLGEGDATADCEIGESDNLPGNDPYAEVKALSAGDPGLDRTLLAIAVVSGLAAFLLLALSYVRHPADIGTTAEWFSGLGAFAAVAVALWQTVNVQRQARVDAEAASQRLKQELQNAKAMHDAELSGQKQLAYVQRMHLLEQQQKRALIDLTRAVYDYGFTFADLQEDIRDAWKLSDKRARENALRAIARQQGTALQKAAAECDNVEMMVEQDDILTLVRGALRDALESAQLTAEEVRTAAQDGALFQESARRAAFARLVAVQSTMYRIVAETKDRARTLLRTGYDV